MVTALGSFFPCGRVQTRETLAFVTRGCLSSKHQDVLESIGENFRLVCSLCGTSTTTDTDGLMSIILKSTEQWDCYRVVQIFSGGRDAAVLGTQGHTQPPLLPRSTLTLPFSVVILIPCFVICH